MSNSAGRDEDDGARRELDQELQLDEVKMSAFLRVELTHSTNCAPSVRNVWGVAVAFADTAWPEVPSGGGKNAVLEEGAAALVVEVVEGEQLSGIVVPELGGVSLKPS